MQNKTKEHREKGEDCIISSIALDGHGSYPPPPHFLPHASLTIQKKKETNSGERILLRWIFFPPLLLTCKSHWADILPLPDDLSQSDGTQL